MMDVSTKNLQSLLELALIWLWEKRENKMIPKTM